MSEPNGDEKVKRFKLTKVALLLICIMVVATGFIGVQVWMEWDDTQRAELERVRESEKASSGAKKDVAALLEKKAPAKGDAAELPKPAKVKNDQRTVSELPGLDVYMLQVGSFSDADGAGRMVKQLNRMGFGGTGVEVDGAWKVMATVSFQRDQASTLQARIEEAKISVLPVAYHIEPGRFSLESDSQRMTAFLESRGPQLPQLMQELCDAYCIYEGQGFDAQSHKTLLLKQKNQLADCRTELQNMTVAAADEQAKARLDAFLGTYQTYLDKASRVQKLDRQTLWGGLVQVFVAYRTAGTPVESAAE